MNGGGASGWKVERAEDVGPYTIEWAGSASFVLSRGQQLFRTSLLGSSPAPIGRVDVPGWQRVASRARPLQRLLRLMFYNVIEAADGSTFVTFARTVGVFRNGSFHALGGLERPSRFLRGACAVGKDGSIYLGEYLPNHKRGPMRIYRWAPGSSGLAVVYVFPDGAIRHIHGIYYDPFDACYWCLTGDNGREARILRTQDFKTLETIGEGDETWRCVSLLFTDEGIYYGMDAEFVQNGLYRLDRRTLERTRLGDVGGPVYYSRSLGKDLFFGVTAELCPSQSDRSAALWHVGPDRRCDRVVSFLKDPLPRAFMVGTLDFPSGPGTQECLWFRGTAIKGGDDVTFRVQRV